MQINVNTPMLLFRYSTYKNYDFINEHLQIINQKGYVWLLKAGRKSNPSKIDQIVREGGWMILKAPKKDGGKYYLSKFENVFDKPSDENYPDYYHSFLDEQYNDEQWFKVISIMELPENGIPLLALDKNGKSVESIIPQTRTAVMFIHNSESILF